MSKKPPATSFAAGKHSKLSNDNMRRKPVILILATNQGCALNSAKPLLI